MAHRSTAVLFAVAWGLVAAGAVAAGVFEAPSVAVVGIGQLGAASAMVVSARGHASWERFWGWLALTAAAKHLFHVVSHLTPEGSALDGALVGTTALLVAAFVLRVARWWRQGVLRHPPAVAEGPLVGLTAALVVWALAAAFGQA